MKPTPLCTRVARLSIGVLLFLSPIGCFPVDKPIYVKPVPQGVIGSTTKPVAELQEVIEVSRESRHLSNITQLTSGFDKAGEGYFSKDMKWVVFQATPKGETQYQMYVAALAMPVDGKPALSTPVRISPAHSRTAPHRSTPRVRDTPTPLLPTSPFSDLLSHLLRSESSLLHRLIPGQFAPKDDKHPDFVSLCCPVEIVPIDMLPKYCPILVVVYEVHFPLPICAKILKKVHRMIRLISLFAFD